MKMRKKMKNIKNFLIILIISALAFLGTCESTLGLGDRIDMEGPVLRITAPRANQAVDGSFVLSGTIDDQMSAVDRLEVRILYNSLDIDGEYIEIEFPAIWRYFGPRNRWEVSVNDGIDWKLLNL